MAYMNVNLRQCISAEESARNWKGRLVWAGEMRNCIAACAVASLPREKDAALFRRLKVRWRRADGETRVNQREELCIQSSKHSGARSNSLDFRNLKPEVRLLQEKAGYTVHYQVDIIMVDTEPVAWANGV